MNAEPSTSPLHVGVSAWIIQDGNYSDFSVGQEARFALEFSSFDGLEPSASGAPFTEHHAASRYAIRGKVLFAAPKVWVIDTGRFLAFNEEKPPAHALQGSFVEGDIYLGIDPYFYFEYLHALEGMPALSYSWRVQAIEMETTPWLEEKDASGRTTLTRRDKLREFFVDVPVTDAWKDDSGNAHYVLACLPQGTPGVP